LTNLRQCPLEQPRKHHCTDRHPPQKPLAQPLQLRFACAVLQQAANGHSLRHTCEARTHEACDDNIRGRISAQEKTMADP
jgi:hypothetical protein